MTTEHRLILEVRDEDNGTFDEVSTLIETVLLHNLAGSSLKFTVLEYEEEE